MKAPQMIDFGDDGIFKIASEGHDTVSDAEAIRLYYKDCGDFALTRHYDGKWYVYTRATR